MSSKVVHFEIGAEDPERASDFYHNVFGWEIKKWEDEGGQRYWLATTGDPKEPGINGGIFQRVERVQPVERIQEANAYVCTINVEDLDESIEKIRSFGGQILTDKLEIPEGYLAYANDTEGNIFGIIQGLPNRKG